MYFVSVVLIASQKHILLLSILKTVVLLYILVETMIPIFNILLWIQSSQELHLFEIEILCVNVKMCLLSLLINWMCPCWTKVLFSLKGSIYLSAIQKSGTERL